MESYISVPIQTAQFLKLANFLQSKNDPRDPVEVIATAIEYWLDNADWKTELLSQIDSNVQGYQWKNLFLSNGTQIRMQYKGTYFYAKVEGDEIIYNGKPISPGSLANTITKSSRNAWRDLWIKRPEDKKWELADNCRPEKIAVGEKLLQELEANGP